MDLIVVVRVIVMCCVRGSCSDVLLVEVVSVHSSLSPAQLQSVLSSAGLSPGAHFTAGSGFVCARTYILLFSDSDNYNFD